MARRRAVLVTLTAVLLASCAAQSNSSGGSATGGSAKPVGSGTLAVPAAAVAGALSWDSGAAAFNGPMPPADPKTVCGADDRRFLGELLQGSPLEYKVPKRLADVKNGQSQMLISGTITESVLGTGDFPFDHTMGSDFNADVKLDQPFVGVGQNDAKPVDSLHIELAAGQLPHLVTAPGAAERVWTDMTKVARENIQTGFVPGPGDRVLVMGSWIVDCGHTNFQTELHPITFLAVARTEGGATVVHTFYNPWRETQLYNPDPAKALAFEDPSRMTGPATVPFPKGLIDSILRIQDAGAAPYKSTDRLSSWAMLEPNTTSPVGWQVCAPPGTGDVSVGARFSTRAGVKIEVTPTTPGCAAVRTSIDGMAAGKPTPKVCTTPWDFLSEVATEEAGGEEKKGEPAGAKSKIDLKEQLGKFVQPPFKSRLEPDPTMNCYDALQGPDLSGARPTTVDVTSDGGQLLPFFGTIVIRRRT